MEASTLHFPCFALLVSLPVGAVVVGCSQSQDLLLVGPTLPVRELQPGSASSGLPLLAVSLSVVVVSLALDPSVVVGSLALDLSLVVVTAMPMVSVAPGVVCPVGSAAAGPGVIPAALW